MINRIKASHIAVGTELTSGQTLNTNSHKLAGYLQAQGVLNQFHFVVPDNKHLIKKVIDLAVKDTDWVFIYGGLGPTTDDFTRNVVAEWANLELVFNESVWLYIKNYLSQRQYPIREFQKQQAYFPKGSIIMENYRGTAHGFYFPWQDKKFFVFPGPPKEIDSICESFLYKFIEGEMQKADPWLTYLWNTMGLGESEVANQVEKEIASYSVEVGYRVHLPYVEVKISFFKSQLPDNISLLAKLDSLLAPILVYKETAPFKTYFNQMIKNVSEFEVQDQCTYGLINKDFESWIDNFKEKKLIYKNYIETPQLKNFMQIGIKNENTFVVNFCLEDVLHSFQVTKLPVQKLPIERQILFLKEKIYIELWQLKLNVASNLHLD